MRYGHTYLLWCTSLELYGGVHSKILVTDFRRARPSVRRPGGALEESSKKKTSTLGYVPLKFQSLET